MPQSVRNEQCNSTITDTLNDSKTATAIGVGDTLHCLPLSYIIRQTLHSFSEKILFASSNVDVFPKQGLEQALNNFLPTSVKLSRFKNSCRNLWGGTKFGQLCLGLENHSRINIQL